jgi:hypothetical protein
MDYTTIPQNNENIPKDHNMPVVVLGSTRILTKIFKNLLSNFLDVLILNWLILKLNRFICDGQFSESLKPQSVISQTQLLCLLLCTVTIEKKLVKG